MKELLHQFVFIHTAEEHRTTRILLTLATLGIGWTIAGVLHGLGAF